MEKIDARVIANSLLDIADGRAIALSHMQVQKLVYLSHGWHYAACGIGLIRNDFEAWEHGPVVKALYGALRQYGNSKIDGRALWYDALQDKWQLATAELTQDAQDIVERVFNRYGTMSAFELSDLTHEPGSPWHDVWHSAAGIGNFGMRISEQLIRDYFDLLSRSRRSILLT